MTWQERVCLGLKVFVVVSATVLAAFTTIFIVVCKAIMPLVCWAAENYGRAGEAVMTVIIIAVGGGLLVGVLYACSAGRNMTKLERFKEWYRAQTQPPPRNPDQPPPKPGELTPEERDWVYRGML